MSDETPDAACDPKSCPEDACAKYGCIQKWNETPSLCGRCACEGQVRCQDGRGYPACMEPCSAATARVQTVADVTDEHRGWLMRVAEPDPLRWRSFVLGKGFGSGVRRWTHEGVEYVGLTDDQRSPGIVGTERIYRADTACERVRQIKRPRKKKVAA